MSSNGESIEHEVALPANAPFAEGNLRIIQWVESGIRDALLEPGITVRVLGRTQNVCRLRIGGYSEQASHYIENTLRRMGIQCPLGDSSETIDYVPARV